MGGYPLAMPSLHVVSACMSLMLARFVLGHIASVTVLTWLAVRTTDGGATMTDWYVALLWTSFLMLGVIVGLAMAVLGVPTLG